jgi:hypothetical protein
MEDSVSVFKDNILIKIKHAQVLLSQLTLIYF